MLAPLARRVCLAFPIEGRDGERYLVTGRPVPRAVVEADRDTARERLGVPPDARCVLVFGGSLGARSVNLAAVEALARRRTRTCCTSPARATSRRCATVLGERAGYTVLEYLDSLADPLAACDLVVARAGGSMFEIAAAGRPAILVPYPHATADHQAKNARWMADAGAAVMLPDAELSRATARRGAGAAGRPERLAQMAAARGRSRGPMPPRGSPARCWRAVRRAATPAASAGMGRPKLHFVGIGGAGMSGLALIAQRARAPTCRGCDAAETPYFDELRAAGIEPHDRPRRLACATDAELVVSTAIPADLPEVAARASAGACPSPRRAARRGRVAAPRDRGRRARTARRRRPRWPRTALAACGRRAGYAVGAELPLPGGGTAERRCGQRGSGWSSRPTSPTARSWASIPRSPCSRTSSSTTTRPTRPRSRCGRRSERSSSVLRRRHRRGVGGTAHEPPPASRDVRFGLGPMPTLRRARRRADRHGHAVHARASTGEAVGEVDLPVPGEHNVLNALAAIARLRAPPAADPAQAARRWRASVPRAGGSSCKGEAGGVRVFDDYAHHATEVAATLRGGARARRRGGWWPSSSRICTRARCTPIASWAARWRSRTWSWCWTCTRRGSARGELRRA